MNERCIKNDYVEKKWTNHFEMSRLNDNHWNARISMTSPACERKRHFPINTYMYIYHIHKYGQLDNKYLGWTINFDFHINNMIVIMIIAAYTSNLSIFHGQLNSSSIRTWSLISHRLFDAIKGHITELLIIILIVECVFIFTLFDMRHKCVLICYD